MITQIILGDDDNFSLMINDIQIIISNNKKQNSNSLGYNGKVACISKSHANSKGFHNLWLHENNIFSKKKALDS